MANDTNVVIELAQAIDVVRARGALRTMMVASLQIQPDDPLVIDTLLATSELMSNALEHTSGHCTVRAHLSSSRHVVRVEVTDTDPLTGLHPQMPGPEQHHGRGLAIVEAIASRWGTERSAAGKTVWFEIERPASTALDR
ncbi:MAG: ATP-binding protein [Ilumatobacteraceae bacterium]